MKKTNDYTLTALAIPFIIALIFELGLSSCTNASKFNPYKPLDKAVPNKLLIETKDDRGFSSVIFTEGKDTFGLDFLSPAELDSFKKSEGFNK